MNKVWGLIFGVLIVAECVCVVLNKTIAFGVAFGAIIVAIGALLLWLGKPKKLAIMFIVAGVLLENASEKSQSFRFGMRASENIFSSNSKTRKASNDSKERANQKVHKGNTRQTKWHELPCL